MSSIVSGPSQRGRFTPKIQHPASRLSAPETISISGRSSNVGGLSGVGGISAVGGRSSAVTELQRLAEVESEVSGSIVKKSVTGSHAGSRLAKSIASLNDSGTF